MKNYRSAADRALVTTELAYHFWEERGCPEGSPEEDWYKAEVTIDRAQDTEGERQAALGALNERSRTGKGRLLEIAMQEAMIHYMRTCFATMMRTGKPAQRRGAKPSAGNNAPAGLFPAKGGGPNDYLYITTSRANPEHWTRLMKLIGREDLIEDPRFATGDVRVQNSEELDGIIGEWTSKHDKRDAMEKLIAIGVPAGAVFDTMELQNEPTFEARGFMQHVKHHNGEDKMATWPVRVDGKSVRLKGAPALGQHTEEVLGGWLGLAAADIAALRNDGVF